MSIQVGLAGPPHRDECVAQFHVLHDASLEIPAEIFRKDGKLMIGIFAREGGISWEYTVAEFLQAIAQGMEILDGEAT
jgi:hypothetical protein